MPTRFAQRGWLGLIGLLIALVIVAVLARTVLRSYGLLGGEHGASPAPSVPAAAPADAGSTAAAPVVTGPRAVTAPLERARGLERDLQRGAADLDRRIDEQTK